MRLGLAQIATRVGDVDGNARRVVAAARAATAEDADAVLFAELCLPGTAPRDLLYEPGFVRDVETATADLAAALRGCAPTWVGTIARAARTTPRHPGLYNALALCADGRVAVVVHKRLLPAYDVFHEPRWFVPGAGASPPVELAGERIGALVCEDLWSEGYPIDPAADLRAAGATVVLCAAASPYRPGVDATRVYHARRAAVPVAYVNAVGGHDELVFDGGSFVIDGAGARRVALPRFAEAVAVVEVGAGALGAAPATAAERPEGAPVEQELFAALVLGVRDFARKNGIARAVVGLSGGVDSALVAAVAAEALGRAAVTAVALPSRYTDPRSTAAARELAAALGIAFETVALEPLHAAAEATLAGTLGAPRDGDTTLENVQARLRALVLMALVNRRGGMLLNTSNKTELALGYGTLYGDLAGALAVIGDLTKPQVYAVARWWNATHGGRIPAFVLERAPSAELRPGQVDPFDYERVGPFVDDLVHRGDARSAGDADTPRGLDPGEAACLTRMVRAAEHKRWQAPIVLKVSERAFGTGRMVPVTRAR